MQSNKISPSLLDRMQFSLLAIRDIVFYFVTRKYSTFIFCFRYLSPKYLSWTSRIRAKRAFYHAAKYVPAYRIHMQDKKIAGWNDIPQTDKDTYIRLHSTEARCMGGFIPDKNVMIDESSGSTGIPYNWVRSARERHESHGFVSFFSTFCYGKKPWITINAFSMGAWATGINMGIALQKNGIVKNTGPDIAKILHTLQFFGAKYNYIITGYPPFLKQLADHAKATGVPMDSFNISALVGGEGMSEGLRDYLLRDFKKVFSGYGATDLEIGIAGETPLSISIRRLARENADVRKALFGEDSRLPMIFQYNPLMHFIEVNDNRELIFTITRKSILSPRIKYNIHDEGGVMRFDEMKAKLKALGFDTDEMTTGEANKNLSFPFMWIYGRRDFTISIMGANIYPEDIEQCLYADEELAEITRSFCQSLAEGENAKVRPAFYFEITVPPTAELQEKFAKSILEKLIALNADFREAWHEYPDTLVPEIHLYPLGEGPFKSDSGKIKQTRVIK